MTASSANHRSGIGPLLMLSASIIFTALNLIIKILGPHFRIWDIAFYRFLGGMILIVLFFRRQKNPFRGNKIRLLILRGLVGSISFLSLVKAIHLLPISSALVYFYTFPVFAAVFAWILYREKMSKGALLCIATVFAGAIIFFNFKLQGGMAGQLLGITSGLFAGMTVTLIRRLKECNDAVIIYLYFCTVGLLVSLPMYLQAPAVPANPREWLLCAGVVLTSLTAQIAMNQGFAYCRGWEGGLFMTSEAVFTALIGIVFFGDPATWRFWTGGLMIVGSGVVLNLHNHRSGQGLTITGALK